VAEVPDQRAEDRRVDPVELLLAQGADQLQRALTCLGEAVRDRVLGLGGGGARDD